MYPLYRSWLGAPGAPCHDSGAFQTPPDTIIIVGDTTASSSRQFAGHRAVLTAHSGFFKGALGTRTTPTSICVPSVFPEAFGPLLSFMYTGYLDISPENIYAVLLATHYLHMPRALDLCWSYLRQNQLLATTVPTATPLVKPIPSRGKLPALSWHQPPSLNTILATAEHSPFRSVYSQPGAPQPSTKPVMDDIEVDVIATSVPPSLPAASTIRPVFVSSPSPTRPTTPPINPPSPHQPVSPDVIDKTSTSPPPPPVETPPRESSSNQESPTQQDTWKRPKSREDRNASPSPAVQSQSSMAPSTASSKVVIDVACCDGPVRFHRVLNQSYGLAEDAAFECADDTGSDDAGDENLLNTKRVRLPGAAQLRRARAERLAAAAAASGGGSPGSTPPRNAPGRPPGAAPDGQLDYTCLYCNHTFKSHYCYQKHASRHLNPVSSKGVIGHVKGVGMKPSAARTASAGVAPRPGRREAVRPLDMNVQYYPCKTCGSKFPSYYFVHKHRKMCHAGENNENPTHSQSSGGDTTKSTEDTTKSTEDTTKSLEDTMKLPQGTKLST